MERGAGREPGAEGAVSLGANLATHPAPGARCGGSPAWPGMHTCYLTLFFAQLTSRFRVSRVSWAAQVFERFISGL